MSKKKVEILFDEKTGKFVIHYEGVPTHEEEHKITEQLLERLHQMGYEVTMEHYHDKPKLPDLDDPSRGNPRIPQRHGGH